MEPIVSSSDAKRISEGALIDKRAVRNTLDRDDIKLFFSDVTSNPKISSPGKLLTTFQFEPNLNRFIIGTSISGLRSEEGLELQQSRVHLESCVDVYLTEVTSNRIPDLVAAARDAILGLSPEWYNSPKVQILLGIHVEKRVFSFEGWFSLKWLFQRIM